MLRDSILNSRFSRTETCSVGKQHDVFAVRLSQSSDIGMFGMKAIASLKTMSQFGDIFCVAS